MSAIDLWLNEATKCLSRESSARVREEVRSHYESARESALARGASPGTADAEALRDLGEASEANRQYRAVMLTSSEARLLREGNFESRFVCSRAWRKWAMAALLTAVAATAAYFREWPMAASAAALGMLYACAFLPIYTPSRSQAFRLTKWIVLAACLILGLKLSWLMFACLGPVAWNEWNRISMRRKLPVSQWPRQLYL